MHIDSQTFSLEFYRVVIDLIMPLASYMNCQNFS